MAWWLSRCTKTAQFLNQDRLRQLNRGQVLKNIDTKSAIQVQRDSRNGLFIDSEFQTAADGMPYNA